MHKFQAVQQKSRSLASTASLTVALLLGYFSIRLPVQAQNAQVARLQSSTSHPALLSKTALQLFKGEWHFHSGLLTVESDGHATFITRAYQFCGPGISQPCDSWQGNTIIPGIQENIVLSKIDASTAYGTITSSTDNKTQQQVTLTLQPNDTLEFNGRFLCGPKGPVGYCGA